MNIYIGNLPANIEESDLQLIFGEYGKVHSIKLIKDFDTGKLKGFGFVEMDQEPGRKAIADLNEATLGDKEIRVTEARIRDDKRRGAFKPNRFGPGRKMF